jgi:predicted O-methyltransferase YrrM
LEKPVLTLLRHAKKVLPPAVTTRLRTLRDRRRVQAALGEARADANHKGELALAIGALEAAARGTADAGARGWFERIEARRLELLRSRRPVSIIDYGLDPKNGPVHREASVGKVTEASRSRPWCEFLFHLARAARPERAIEMGACVGISASYLAAALEMNGTGRLVTLEGDPVLSGLTGETLSGLGLAHRAEVVRGPFDATLAASLERMRPVDLLFHDGAHEAWCYERDAETMRPYLAPGAVVVFDDIRWGDTDTIGAWRKIVAHAQVKGALDCGAIGVFVTKAA